MALRQVLTLGPHFLLMVAVIANFTTMGAVMAGSSAAVNESIDYNPNLFHNVTEQVKQNVSANTTGVRGSYAMSQLRVFTTVINTVSAPAYDFGYHHPKVSPWYVDIAKIVTFAGVALYGYGQFREARRKL